MKQTIYYIAGSGRSGSTLFDICLGNLEHTFSLGELIFFVQNGIIEKEYCSCGKTVPECEFWSEIIIEWDKQRVLSIIDYMNIQRELTRNKNTFKNIYYYFFSKNSHRQYIKDLSSLYKILFKKTGKAILVDSSKNAQYILILRKLPFDIKILHLTRGFSGVLNSKKKKLKKNSSQGIEEDLKPQKLSYSFSIWILDNFLSFFYSIGMTYKRIKYEDLVLNPLQTIKQVHDVKSKQFPIYRNRGSLKAEHLVAGNKMRMAEKIFIEEPKQMKWESNVKPYQKKIARLIDYFY